MKTDENGSAEKTNKDEGLSSRLRKGAWTGAGIFFLCLGIIGIVLPVLPTTPFLLLSAACFLKGSKRMHDWLMGNKVLGTYIRNYREGRGIPLRSKVISIALLWLTIGATVMFFVRELWLQAVLLIIAVGVSVHIASIRPKRPKGQA